MRNMSVSKKHTIIGLLLYFILLILFVDSKTTFQENILTSILAIFTPQILLPYYIYLTLYYAFFRKNRSFYSIMIPLALLVSSLNFLFLMFFYIMFNRTGNGYSYSDIMICLFFPFDMGILYLVFIAYHIKKVTLKVIFVIISIISYMAIMKSDIFDKNVLYQLWAAPLYSLAISTIIVLFLQIIFKPKKLTTLLVVLFAIVCLCNTKAFAWGQLTHMVLCEKVAEKNKYDDLHINSQWIGVRPNGLGSGRDC